MGGMRMNRVRDGLIVAFLVEWLSIQDVPDDIGCAHIISFRVGKKTLYARNALAGLVGFPLTSREAYFMVLMSSG